MTDTPSTAGEPARIIATLLLERPADIDYRELTNRIGNLLEIDPSTAEQEPGFPMVVVAGGAVVFGMRIDAPYPEPLESVAQCAYWWPNAVADVARNTCHVIIAC